MRTFFAALAALLLMLAPASAQTPAPVGGATVDAVTMGLGADGRTRLACGHPDVVYGCGLTPPGAWVSRSGSIATGGTAQQLAPANALRRGLVVQNPSSAAGSLYILHGGTASASGNSIELRPGWSYSAGSNPSSQAISVFSATTGHVFFAQEM